MKICLLYDHQDAPFGGVNTFFRNFSELAQNDSNITVVKSGDISDIVLTSGSMRSPKKILKDYQLLNVASGRSLGSPVGRVTKKKKAKVVFRVDGLKQIYTKERVGRTSDDRLIKNIKNADAVIYQSNYSRECFAGRGMLLPDDNIVITNGANNHGYKVDRKSLARNQRLQLVSSSWSMNENKGFSTIAQFSCSDQVNIVHIGRWPSKIDPERVKVLGVKHYLEVPQILANFHYLLFPSRNEACSNTVVEALSVGLPVLYHPSGGTSELCANESYGIRLPNGTNGMQGVEQFLIRAREEYCELSERVSDNLALFQYENCYYKYINYFTSLL